MEVSLLKHKKQELKETFSTNLSLRVHRALSWLERSEQCSSEDIDAQFIFLWIAFNSAYACNGEKHKRTEAESYTQFIAKLVDLEQSQSIYKILWQTFPSSIRLLLNNQYVFQPFWDFHNGKIEETEWQNKFSRAKKAANAALGNQDTVDLASNVLSRLYTLRNQLMHGGATYNSSANRAQLKDAVNIMKQVVPVIINVMMDNPNTLWGDAHYPYLGKQQNK